VYLTGQTTVDDFPTTPGAFQATIPQNPTGTPPQAAGNAFVAVLNSVGTQEVYGSYLGSTDATAESGQGIVVDQFANPYRVGATNGTDFPVTRNAFQGSGAPNLSGRVGGLDAFLVVLNTNPQPLAAPNGNQLLYGTYLGGSGGDVANGVAVNVGVEADPN